MEKQQRNGGTNRFVTVMDLAYGGCLESLPISKRIEPGERHYEAPIWGVN